MRLHRVTGDDLEPSVEAGHGAAGVRGAAAGGALPLRDPEYVQRAGARVREDGVIQSWPATGAGGGTNLAGVPTGAEAALAVRPAGPGGVAAALAGALRGADRLGGAH